MSSRSVSGERKTYLLSNALGAFFLMSTRLIHSWLDPDAIDPMALRLVVAGALVGGALTAKFGSLRSTRAATVAAMCLVNLYAGWICGINELAGPWPHALFTAYISTSIIVGPFSPTARSAALRVLAMTVCLGAACTGQLEDKALGITAALHAGIIGSFVALISIVHIGTRCKLESARDRAVDGTKAKAQFLANMSHEIRTPMNGVLGTASLLDDGTLREDQAELVHTLNASGEALLAIINDILDLSKIEAGAIELEAAPFDLAGLLGDSVALLRPVAVGRETSLELRLDGVPAEVIGDAFRIRQVMTNLLSNAIKFTSGGTIAVSATWSEDQCRLVVRDSGIGIEPERLESIFESFRQADESTTRRFGGTGLGLTISREIVRRMGGTIEVTSEVGVGSEFRVVLPLVQVCSEVEPRAPLPQVARDHRIFQGLRVLLADDNPVNRRVAGKMLERFGITPSVAVDGREAVAAAEAEDFDVILMDVQMPNLDGLEATRRIRAFPAPKPQPKIIALTAGATPEDREATQLAGADEHVTKPIRIEELRAAVERSAVSGR